MFPASEGRAKLPGAVDAGRLSGPIRSPTTCLAADKVEGWLHLSGAASVARLGCRFRLQQGGKLLIRAVIRLQPVLGSRVYAAGIGCTSLPNLS